MKAINLEELVLLTHPGELRAIRDAKGSVYVPGWKTPKPAAVACQWKLETICKFIEQKRLYFYPVTEEHKALARSVAVIQAPPGNPDIVIDGPEPHPEIVPAAEEHAALADKVIDGFAAATGMPRELIGPCTEPCDFNTCDVEACIRRLAAERNPEPTPLNPEQAEAIQTLNTLRRAWYQRNNPGDKQGELLDTIITVLAIGAIIGAIIVGGTL